MALDLDAGMLPPCQLWNDAMPTAHFVRHATSLSTNTVGTDALNAMLRISGVSSPQIIEESDGHAVVTYEWDAQGSRPDDLDSHFRGFGLHKI